MSVSVFLAVLFLASALAAPAIAEEASDQLAGYSVTITAMGSGNVRVVVSVFGTHNQMTKIGFPSVILYESTNNGTTWRGVEAHSGKYNPNVPAGSYSFTFTYKGVAGRKYSAYSSFYAQDSLGNDTKSADSPVITAS